jgi:Putative auto-transporter adhesin, head GIN domain
MKRNIQSLCEAINRQFIIKLFFPSLLLLFSFRPGEGTGGSTLPVVKKEVKLATPFQSVNIHGDVSVILTNEPAGTITMAGIEKDLDRIRYKVKNNELIIDTYRKNILRDLTIYLSAATLQSIQLNGEGNIYSTVSIKQEGLHLLLNGNIKVKVYTKGKLTIDATEGYQLFWETRLLQKAE